MLSKVSRLAIILAVLTAGILSFLTVRAHEQLNDGIGWDYGIWAQSGNPSLTDQAFAARIDAIAREARVSVWCHRTDRENAVSGATLYQAGDTDRFGWLATGRYPAFTGGMNLRVRSISEFGDARRAGLYYVVGPEATRDLVMERFGQLKLDPKLLPLNDRQAIFSKAFDVPADSFTLLMSFLLFMLVAAGVFLNARPLAVTELQGRSFGEILAMDAGAGVRSLLLGLGGLFLVTVPILYWYNQLHWYGLFLCVAAMFLGVLLGGAAGVHVAALLLVRRMSVLHRIKGELGGRGVHILVYGARLTALVLTFASLAHFVAQEELVQTKISQAGLWASTRGNVQMSLADMGAPEAQDTAERALGRWLDGQERAGELILVKSEIARYFFLEGTEFADPRAPVLTVNSTYLRERPIRDVSGAVIPAQTDSPDVRVLVPAAWAKDEATIVAKVRNDVQFERELRRQAVARGELAADPPGTRAPQVQVIRAQPGQRAFVYANDLSWNRSPFVTDPIVVVLPSVAPIFSPGQWAGAVGSRQVILRRKDKVIPELRRNDLLRYVSNVDEVPVTNAVQTREVTIRANLYRFSLFAVGWAMVVTALSFAMVHTRRYAANIFVQHLHGWAFLKRHRGLLVLDTGVIAAVTVGWLWWTQQIDPNVPLDLQPSPPPAWTGWSTAILAAVLLWWGVHRLSRSVIRRRAAV